MARYVVSHGYGPLEDTESGSMSLHLLKHEASDPSAPFSDCDVRIVLVGKTGAGKSASGNTILGIRNFFKEEASAVSITTECKAGFTNHNSQRVCVVDTPGLFGSLNEEEEEEKIKIQIKDSVRMSLPGPHAFLLVIRIGRFTEEEKKAVEWIQENFGEDASLYTIILFTHVDDLKGKPLDTYTKESRDLLRFIDRCGGRYHGFNNDGEQNQDQVIELLKKIDEMVERNGGGYYTNEIFQRAQEEMLQRAKEEKQRKIKEKIKEAALGAATVIGVGGAVAGGAVIVATEALVLPAAGAIAGGALALGTGAKLVYDKVKKKTTE